MVLRPRRILSGEEAELWQEIAKLVTPLRGRVKLMETQSSAIGVTVTPSTVPSKITEPPTKPLAKRGVMKLGGVSQDARQRATHPATFSPSMPGLERRERRGLHRGSLPIEARVDLHGLFQAEAHSVLTAFLIRAHAAGYAHVLVVTGKGSDERGMFNERGILRRSVPHWLRSAKLSPIVLGFEEAAHHHGGAGALYVRLKRR